MGKLLAGIFLGPIALLAYLWRHRKDGAEPQRTYEGSKWADDDAPHDRRGYGGGAL
jgi:hypothetical protein